MYIQIEMCVQANGKMYINDRDVSTSRWTNVHTDGNVSTSKCRNVQTEIPIKRQMYIQADVLTDWQMYRQREMCSKIWTDKLNIHYNYYVCVQ